jgi:hypothetical protein
METLRMSRKEGDWLTIMKGIKRRELTLVQAAQVMDLSYRQAKRVWRRYRDEGDFGVVYRSRGAPSPRQLSPELRQRVLAWISFLELPHLTCKALSNYFTSAFQFCIFASSPTPSSSQAALGEGVSPWY